jgi:thioredoxin 1
LTKQYTAWHRRSGSDRAAARPEEEPMRVVRGAAIVAMLVVAMAGIAGCGEPASAEVRARAAASTTTASTRPIPHLVDVGAGKCIPCKAMAPILDRLRIDYAGRLRVTFVDAWKVPEEARPYGVRMIPTQIFYGADGRELARHEGFMSREDILAQWKALGIEL